MAVAVTRDNLVTAEAGSSALLISAHSCPWLELGCVTSAPVQRQLLTDAARLAVDWD